MTRHETTKKRGTHTNTVVALRPRAQGDLINTLQQMQVLLDAQSRACRRLRTRVGGLHAEMKALGGSMSRYHGTLTALDVSPLRNHCGRLARIATAG